MMMLLVIFEGFGGWFVLEERQMLIPLFNEVGLQYDLMPCQSEASDIHLHGIGLI